MAAGESRFLTIFSDLHELHRNDVLPTLETKSAKAFNWVYATVNIIAKSIILIANISLISNS